MNWFYKPYVSVAERRRKAEKKLAAMRKKGEVIESVAAATPRGKIAVSFWGQAWCEHLESYSDYANRLPRGRTYLRNGSVMNLRIETGCIHALVMGSRLYEQTIRIEPLANTQWEAVKKRCAGKIGSMVELLQGKLSSEIMRVVTDRTSGLFPGPKQIHMDCSCPDWAGLCKHLAAVLYGVGARLDEAPELLFKLRGVDHTELIQTDTTALVNRSGRSRRIASAALGDVFGIDLEADPIEQAKPVAKRKTTAGKATAPKASAQKIAVKKTTAAKKKPVAAKSKPRTKALQAEFKPSATAVRNLRNQLGLSRAALARELGVSAPTVTNWESHSGKLTLQSRTLAAIQKLYKQTKVP